MLCVETFEGELFFLPNLKAIDVIYSIKKYKLIRALPCDMLGPSTSSQI